MSLGTSVFLSAIVVSFVALFIATKDRWNWKRLVWWLLGLPVLLVAVASAGFYLYSSMSERPKPQVSFWDIPLTATESDVKFLKGTPTRILDKDWWVYEQPKKTSYDDDFTYVVQFREGKVWFILFLGSGYLGAPDLQGFRYGASYQDVLDKFGPPSYVSVSEDDLERTLSFERFNVVVGFRENRVVQYGIHDPKFGAVRYTKEKSSVGTSRAR